MQTIDKTPTEEVSSAAAENETNTPEDAITISASLFRHVMEATELANEVVEACDARDDDPVRALSEFVTYVQHRCKDWRNAWNPEVYDASDVAFALINADRTAATAYFRQAGHRCAYIDDHRCIERAHDWLVKACAIAMPKRGGAR